MIRESLALKFEEKGVWILDQTLLPIQEKWILASSPEEMVGLIQRLAVRGAPLIGVAAALSLGHYTKSEVSKTQLERAANLLKEARPTAVNLQHAIDRCVKVFPLLHRNSNAVLDEALDIFDEDVRLCLGMARNGAPLIQDGDNILTHCNTGGLATAGLGTALSVIIEAFRSGKKLHVYVDETRPLLQGLRLTAWELSKHQIPFTVITDSMSGWLMKQKKIHRVFVGADRIAANGDSANKIGTYSLAIIAQHHGVPFHVVAPQSTFDPACATGAEIPIELRKANEITGLIGQMDYPAWNPSFDVTPAQLITSIVMDHGVFSPNEIKI